MARKQVYLLIFLMSSPRLELRTLSSYTVLMLSITDLKSTKQSSGISQSKIMKEFSFQFSSWEWLYINLWMCQKTERKKGKNNEKYLFTMTDLYVAHVL